MDTVVHNSIVDSTRWNSFLYRKGDVVIATFGKTGTTWVQQIVGQLIFGGADDISVGAISPWIDYRRAPLQGVLDLLNQQKHRRFVKTHLPREALPFSDSAFYIYVARDARDQIWSAYNHLANLKSSSLGQESIDAKGTGTAPDARSYYHQVLDRTGEDRWPYWCHVLSWWNARDLPNVLLIHFATLKADLAGGIDRIAQFLQIRLTDEVMHEVVAHCSFEYMKRNADRIVGNASAANILRDAPAILINQGLNGRWRSVLTEEEIDKCDRAAAANLPPECANWLKTGER